MAANSSDKTANPAPLGLLGFGLTTVLLNFHNAGFFPMDAMILSMGLFYGGLAQIVAGMQEWKKGNTFGATAFTSYGFFWITLVATIVLPKTSLGIAAPTPHAMAAFLGLWGIFSLMMFAGTLKLSMALQVVFASLTVLFFLLAVGDYTGCALVKLIAGWEGIFCGASAIYTGLAEVLNDVSGKTVLPVDKKK